MHRLYLVEAGATLGTISEQLLALLDQDCTNVTVIGVEDNTTVGAMVYGYYGVGSYGYPGGADVKQINIE
jgi:hypothetical protein